MCAPAAEPDGTLNVLATPWQSIAETTVVSGLSQVKVVVPLFPPPTVAVTNVPTGPLPGLNDTDALPAERPVGTNSVADSMTTIVRMTSGPKIVLLGL